MIVQEYTTTQGARISICDDAYAECSAGELAARRALAQRTAWWCAARAAERRTKQSAPTAADRESALPGGTIADARPELVISDRESIAQKREDCKV